MKDEEGIVTSCGVAIGQKSGRQDLRERTKKFALRVIRLYVALPKTTLAQTMGKQVLRAGTSVGAHYREAYRARSTAEFISKVEVALQELDESAYWMELLCAADVVPAARLEPLMGEANELIAILTVCAKKAHARESR